MEKKKIKILALQFLFFLVCQTIIVIGHCKIVATPHRNAIFYLQKIANVTRKAKILFWEMSDSWIGSVTLNIQDLVWDLNQHLLL